MRDKIFKIVLFISALAILLICGGMILSLTVGAIPAFKEFGFFKFIVSSDWVYTRGSESYGALPFIADRKSVV